MDNLIEALQIFNKYLKTPYKKEFPTSCDHDTLYVHVNPTDVSDEDMRRLEALGFEADNDEERFYSFVFGSC